MSNVGALTRLSTLDGLYLSISASALAVGCPVVNTCWCIAQIAAVNRPQPAELAGLTEPAELGESADPTANSRDAHCFLNPPLAGPAPVASGNSAVPRLLHVASGTIASIRWSYAAA